MTASSSPHARLLISMTLCMHVFTWGRSSLAPGPDAEGPFHRSGRSWKSASTCQCHHPHLVPHRRAAPAQYDYNATVTAPVAHRARPACVPVGEPVRRNGHCASSDRRASSRTPCEPRRVRPLMPQTPRARSPVNTAAGVIYAADPQGSGAPPFVRTKRRGWALRNARWR
ncbi:hypothetical protein BC628DRAFT_110139 [Trametes gibbosa]|nr:hypothetical protein BC628DRAFT_614346 [Trametes gibbosa]KAI0828309.1 hypothetical protein BC628DRAFT_110139 [Trametes gibbosa]